MIKTLLKEKYIIIALYLSILSIVFLAFRIFWTGTMVYFFLSWNLLLAWLPFVASIFLKSRKRLLSIQNVLLFVVWLVFLPNTFYILTDLFHIRYTNGMPIWFDVLLIINFALSGFALGFFSLYEVSKFLKNKYKEIQIHIIMLLVLFLSSFGIYLGRFLRWNSWDILTNPVGVFSDILDRIFFPYEHPITYGFTMVYFVFLASIYFLFVLLREKF